MKTKISPDKLAVAMQSELLDNQHDINNVLSAGIVQPIFQGHYFDMDSQRHGIANLIISILTDHDAIFPKNVETTQLRPIAIAAGMFASDIINEVQTRFAGGTTRYPYDTIHHYLSIVMSKKDIVGKVSLTNAEDKPRPCYKPRKKWFLIDT